MPINIGTLLYNETSTEQNVLLNPAMLTKHAAIMGASGSGKTGVVIGVIEELVRNETPVLVLDIKGDMLNVVQQTDQALRDQMYVRLLTPGAYHGKPVNLFGGFNKPECIENSVACLLKTIGEDPNPLTSMKHSYISKILEHLIRTGEDVSIERLVELIKDPPFDSIGYLIADEAVPAKTRNALAAKVNILASAPSFAAWLAGDALDIDLLYTNKPAKTNVTIYSIAHIIDEDQRQFAMALLFDSVLAWMRQQSGTSDLRASFVVDECTGILPPHPYNPPSKRPLIMLMKQARAIGLGVILATQNTKDIDYKALGNCETFIVGRLFMKRDRMTLVESISAQANMPPEVVDYQLSRLKARQFMLVRPQMTTTIISKDVTSTLAGPLTPQQMGGIADE